MNETVSAATVARWDRTTNQPTMAQLLARRDANINRKPRFITWLKRQNKAA